MTRTPRRRAYSTISAMSVAVYLSCGFEKKKKYNKEIVKHTNTLNTHKHTNIQSHNHTNTQSHKHTHILYIILTQTTHPAGKGALGTQRRDGGRVKRKRLAVHQMPVHDIDLGIRHRVDEVLETLKRLEMACTVHENLAV